MISKTEVSDILKRFEGIRERAAEVMTTEQGVPKDKQVC
jgi:hypothetical protein